MYSTQIGRMVCQFICRSDVNVGLKTIVLFGYYTEIKAHLGKSVGIVSARCQMLPVRLPGQRRPGWHRLDDRSNL
jgi:hypothetical protein